jgi:hypothetical protein
MVVYYLPTNNLLLEGSKDQCCAFWLESATDTHWLSNRVYTHLLDRDENTIK